MSSIYKDAEDKFVANYVFHASSAKQGTYTDAQLTKLATKDEVVRAFNQGCIVDYAGVKHCPIACDATGDTAVITIATVGESGAIALVELESA